MMNKRFIYIVLTAACVVGAASAATLTDIRTVAGTAAKTIDGSLGDWTGSEKIISRSDFTGLGSWNYISDVYARTDVYASYANGHLYIGVDMNDINVDTNRGTSGTGVEVFIKVNSQQDDFYCLQAMAQIDAAKPQWVLLYQPSGVTEANDVTPASSSFFGGAVVQAHQVLTGPDMLHTEFDFDLLKIAALTGGLDLVDGDTVSVCIFPRGQMTRRVYAPAGMIWGGDGYTAYDLGFLPVSHSRNDQQGFTGGFKVALPTPTDCSLVQLSAKDAADLDGNCAVNLLDFAKLASNWLGDCTNPSDVNCN